MGKIMTLLSADPLVIAHKTGNSREDTNPEAFSAFTAKSSPKIPAVFLVAILLMVATSSINNAISSKSAKNPEAIFYKFECKSTIVWQIVNVAMCQFANLRIPAKKRSPSANHSPEGDQPLKLISNFILMLIFYIF
jgi:hypothetical protein